MLTIQQIEHARLHIVKKLCGDAEKDYAKVGSGFSYCVRRGLQYAKKDRSEGEADNRQNYAGYYAEGNRRTRGLLYGFLILRAEKLGYYYRGAAGERHEKAYQKVSYMGGAPAYGG